MRDLRCSKEKTPPHCYLRAILQSRVPCLESSIIRTYPNQAGHLALEQAPSCSTTWCTMSVLWPCTTHRQCI
ncbi:MAG: hypothetical protein V8Q84_01190 [Bilophila sp.]